LTSTVCRFTHPTYKLQLQYLGKAKKSFLVAEADILLQPRELSMIA